MDAGPSFDKTGVGAMMFVLLLIHACILPAPSTQAQAVGLDGGYYRCQWYQRPDVTDKKYHPSEEGVPTGAVTSNTQCLPQDSEKMASFINHCTGDSNVPLKTCNTDGTWSCSAFLSMCKTVIRTTSNSRAPVPQKRLAEDVPAPPCLPDPIRRFTLEEMAVAILVSFISGISLLAIVIIIVWKYKNCTTSPDTTPHQESFRKHSERVGALKSLSTLLGSKPERNSGIILNPNYDQTAGSCTPASVVDDILMENERLYEEIILRRQSSCSQHHTIGDCLYSKVSKIQKEKQERKDSRARAEAETRVPILEEDKSDASDVAEEEKSESGKVGTGKRPSTTYESCFGDSSVDVTNVGVVQRENNDSGIYDMVPVEKY